MNAPALSQQYENVFVNDWLKPMIEEREGEANSCGFSTNAAARTYFGDKKSTCKFLTPCNPVQVLRELSRVELHSIETPWFFPNCYRMRSNLKSFEEPRDQKDTMELVKVAVSELRNVVGFSTN